jgi:hypothetical protein
MQAPGVHECSLGVHRELAGQAARAWLQHRAGWESLLLLLLLLLLLPPLVSELPATYSYKSTQLHQTTTWHTRCIGFRVVYSLQLMPSRAPH